MWWRTTLVALVLLAACSGGDDEPAAPSPSTTSAPPAPPSSTTTTTVNPAREQAFVDGDLRFLTPPDQPTLRAGDGARCETFVDEAWEQVACGRVGDAVWVHERDKRAERALVYVAEGAQWRLALRASDDTGDEFDVAVQVVDLMGDGALKVLFVFAVPDRDDGDGVSPPVVADVVEPSAAVVVHVVADYPKGKPTVRPAPGRGLEVWDCETDCVSTAPYRYRRIAYSGGKWTVVEERTDRDGPT